ncbi:gliding motility protein GldB-related protein [Dyadobacter aurulentus]|uniref:gliding motility protein GldB-related protein n=1 Tax=Dyadobacter sp. UC 10 TaxID=2605428 RepID=UPI0011F19A5F|nr:gliding motility protein [Dyadobacter sp. UC 10]KAA0990265.1 gliding motility protein [Dyadobacter sp. UC 10]
MVYLKNIILLFLLAALSFSCKPDHRSEPDISDININIESENLDQQLFACKSVTEVQIFLNKHSYLNKYYFSEAPVDSTRLAGYLFNVLQNPDFQNFKGQLDSLIGDRKTGIIDSLTAAFKRIKYYYPAFQAPQVKFIVTGFTGSDLYISDSLIIIGLDYFGGPAARYRPDVFDYQLRRYQKEYIVPSIVFFLSNKYNRTSPGDLTLLGDMIGYGKGYEFVKFMLPHTPDSYIIGYSDSDLKKTYNSQQNIWGYFIASKLLYEKNVLQKRKFIEERPFTTEIGEKVPGAIARWVGWRIVGMFMDNNPEVSIVELMDIDNASRILQESGYSGQPDEVE